MTVSLRLNRHHLLCLTGGLLLFFGARWAFQQGKPERLQDLPIVRGNRINTLLGIHNGAAYFRGNEFQPSRSVTITDSQGKPVAATLTPNPPFLLRALPVTGQQAHLIGEDRRPGHIFRTVQWTGDSLYYSATPHKARPVTVSLGSYGAGPSTMSAGSGSRKPQNVGWSVPLTRVFLFEMRFTGGSPIALRPDTAFQIADLNYPTGQQIAVVGDNIYWLEVENRQRPPEPIVSLHVISRHGGPPKTLMADLPYGTIMTVPQEATDSLWVSVPAKGEIPRNTLYRATAADLSLRRITRQKDAPPFLPVPLTLNERLYWTRDVQDVHPSAPDIFSYLSRHTEIHSAALDGSEAHILYTFPNACYAPWARVHQGKLYLEVYRGEARQMQSNRYLVRLEPGPPARVYDVFHFPLTAGLSYFDGDYIYYTLQEERGNFWDWSGKSYPVAATVLCRYRLPR